MCLDVCLTIHLGPINNGLLHRGNRPPSRSVLSQPRTFFIQPLCAPCFKRNYYRSKDSGFGRCPTRSRELEMRSERSMELLSAVCTNIIFEVGGLKVDRASIYPWLSICVLRMEMAKRHTIHFLNPISYQCAVTAKKRTRILWCACSLHAGIYHMGVQADHVC